MRRNIRALQQHLVAEDKLRSPGRRVVPAPYTACGGAPESREQTSGACPSEAAHSFTSGHPSDDGTGDGQCASSCSKSKPGGEDDLSKFIIDVDSKLHITLLVLCLPSPSALRRAQELCHTWALKRNHHENGHLAVTPVRVPRPLPWCFGGSGRFPHKHTHVGCCVGQVKLALRGLRCFNKGRGQFVLWAAIENPELVERLARTLSSSPLSFECPQRRSVGHQRGVGFGPSRSPP